MGKAVFPKKLLNSFMEENNEKWINEYREVTDLNEGYYQTLENFFKFKKYESKPFNLFSVSDVSDYIEVMIENNYGTSRIDSIISDLNTFKKFLIEKHPDLFSESLLKDLLELKMGIPEQKYQEAQALNIVQLSYAKEFIKHNIKTEYIFEVFYQLGIQKQDIKMCLPQYADKEKMMFVKKDKTIKYNYKIQELLFKIEKAPKFKATYSMVFDHLTRIGKYLKAKGVYEENKPFTYLDVARTHERFFMKCANCGEEYEVTPENWVLSKTAFGDSYYLVCSRCKGEPNNGTSKVSNY